MPTCRHADNEIIAHGIFYKKKCGVVIKTCRHTDTICTSCMLVDSKGGGGVWGSKHADMPTLTYDSYGYKRVWRGGGGVNTCRHADNEIIAHGIFLEKNGVVIKTCRHTDIICTPCMLVGSKGGGGVWGVKNADMLTYRHYPIIHMGIKEFGGGGRWG